jgi:hypothetical protein
MTSGSDAIIMRSAPPEPVMCMSLLRKLRLIRRNLAHAWAMLHLKQTIFRSREPSDDYMARAGATASIPTPGKTH